MSFVPPKLSLWERVQLIGLYPIIVIKAVLGLAHDLLITRDFRTTTVRRTVAKNIGLGISLLSLRQSRTLENPTGFAIANLCLEQNLQHDSVQIDAGEFPPATLHFIESSASDTGNLLLYLHGGGFIHSMTDGHFNFARRAARASGSTSLAMLEYTLAPELKYPGQLAQAAAALQWLLQSHTISQIIIGGDSAGGNMTLSVLAHLHQPHPDVPPMQALPGKELAFRGAFCISPRCANTSTAPSFTRNAAKDVVGVQSMKLFTSLWHPVEGEVWGTPVCGSHEFWSSISTRRFLIAAGGDECYLDDIKTMAQLIGAAPGTESQRQLVVCAGEIHVQCIIDSALGIKDGIMLTRVLEWLRTL